MTHSMTGYASQTGATDGASWQWEIRSVNARGLDLRLRLPDPVSGVLEPRLRAILSKRLSRGNVSLTLRLDRSEGAAALSLDETALANVLTALDQIQDRALTMGITLAQPTAADVLNQRGVIRQGADDSGDVEALAEVLEQDFAPLLESFCGMRASEGAALEQVISAQLDEIEDLTAKAATAATERLPVLQDNMRRALARVLETAETQDESRIAQELAQIAVKADVTEEIDRLTTHVSAARGLLAANGPKGRKLDFLTQEFNREANTLCSKSQDSALTGIGLALKVVIDQMREQIQNVE